MRYLSILVLVLALLAPLAARGDSKGPLDYSVKQYGFILAVTLLGGLVSYLDKVRKGAAQAWSITQLVGELSTSAFAGLITFWLCEWSNCPQLLTAAMVGISGHMGTRAIQTFELFAQKRWGVDAPPVETKP